MKTGYLAAALLLLAVGAIVGTFHYLRAADVTSTMVTYSNGTLHVAIPYSAPRAGEGSLTVQVLNPEDGVVGEYERRLVVAEGKGSWQADLKLDHALPMDELVWHRLRYRFRYAGDGQEAMEGTDSISEILRRPVAHVMAQQSYLSGAAAAVRVIVTDSQNEPVAGGRVRIELKHGDSAGQALYSGPLNHRGTAEAQIRFPGGLTGAYSLKYVVDTPIGSTEFVQPVRLEDKISILLTTEKPLYQPGQTIHVRALSLDRADRHAAASRNLTFEIDDSRGNKVFKKAVRTDAYGVASTEFTLADEVNLGTYHLRALMDGETRNTAELALDVQRYVLPKFKVALDFAGDDKKTRHGYRPGDHVTGTVRANYFFGKAVDSAEVTLKASTMDVGIVEVGSAEGKTDGDGAWHFDVALPRYFAGRPLSQGAARVLFQATVKDGAGHSETRGEPVTVSESSLEITAIPEGGALAPGIQNQVFVLTSYADGKPAKTKLRIGDRTAETDDSGVAVVSWNAQPTMHIEAADGEGNKLASDVPLQLRQGAEQILLRTERAVYKAGDRIRLRIFSTRQKGSVYLDAVKDGQTVLTRDIDLNNGQAELTLDATPALAGTVDFNAYLFGRDARPVADHRLLFVQPAGELKVEATADRAEYKPGQDARIQFHVTNEHGEGVQAALGVQVVDEAVFALAEKQPGFAKVFFYLEQEAMKPRYEIHSIGMPEAVETAGGAGPRRDLAARALFAATEMVNTNRFDQEFGRAVPQAQFAAYVNRYRTQFSTQAAEGFNRSGAKAQIRDAWGTSAEVRAIGSDTYLVRSAGPDKRFNTADDLYAYLQKTTRNVSRPVKAADAKIDLRMEREVGPFNGLAQITGEAPAGASVVAKGIAGGKVRSTRSDDGGHFSFAGLPAGEYEVEITLDDTKLTSRRFMLVARDRAVVSATLVTRTSTETVWAAAEFPRRMKMGGNVPMGMAGVVGGFLRDEGAVMMEAFAGAGGGGMARKAALSVAAPMAVGALMTTGAVALDSNGTFHGAAPATHVRSYFPEALYINPEIITGGDGRASISIPLADSITTWRMALMASTARGALGSGTSSIKVFQDFFTDLDLPVTLTQGDRITLPVAVYNYTEARGDVSLSLKNDDWYALVQDVPDKNVAVEAGRVGSSQYTIQANRIGKFKLTLAAKMGGRADIVVREIEVIPNGREQTQVFNGRLDSSVAHALTFPPASIPDASSVVVRLYPGPLSQVIEGMDAILRMPGGCFEQTSSSTYPNVLALDYMKTTGKLTPEVHAKAEGFIANGYQRLLTFEVPGGGFSWFGQAPANKILTSYGLMEFSDMAKVSEVDPRLVQRTQQWLASQQQADGSWKPDTQFINEGATNRYNTDLLRIASYIAWSLENSGYRGPAVQKARQFVDQHMGDRTDAYTLAVLANFAAEYPNDREFANRAMQRLLDAKTEKDDQVWWTAEETGMYGMGESAAVETTGLAVQALLKWGQDSRTAAKALAWLTSKKSGAGAWGSTQATIMALRALLLASGKAGADVRGTVEITLNGKAVEKLTLTPDNNDLLHQFVFKNVDAKGANDVALRFDGKGGLAYQVVGRYFVPWNERPANEALSIDVAYDRARLAQDDIATATATVKNNLGKPANMVMVDLGIPPGFELLTEDLQSLQEKTSGQKGGRLEKFNLTATQAILYFDSIGAGQTVKLSFRLRAKYPIRAHTFQSRVYEYYNPDVNSVARPVQLEVAKK
jgi:A-macroglobulin TED domain/Alpha-2-macroglobulin family/A-macroglobulin receptor binding domain/MG2 domain/Alpha-2-macroglobulin bait region domain/Carboxypeptidase regulatory-like domain